jgi:hypothetical protein
MKKEIEALFRPNWHPSLSPLLGDIKYQLGYITEVGTVELIGPLYDNAEISKYSAESEIKGPVMSINATGSIL